jgi:hypothetical protein
MAYLVKTQRESEKQRQISLKLDRARELQKAKSKQSEPLQRLIGKLTPGARKRLMAALRAAGEPRVVSLNAARSASNSSFSPITVSHYGKSRAKKGSNLSTRDSVTNKAKRLKSKASSMYFTS